MKVSDWFYIFKNDAINLSHEISLLLFKLLCFVVILQLLETAGQYILRIHVLEGEVVQIGEEF
jgi:hypothetical protein